MSHQRLTLVSTLLSLAIIHPASADSFINGNDLYEQCLKPSPVFCQAYVMGIAEVISKGTDAMKVGGMMICLPQGTNTRQLMDVVTASLRDSPEQRTTPAHYLVMNALLKAWPCPQ